LINLIIISRDYLKYKLSNRELENKLINFNILLESYPIGDLVENLNNDTEDNIIHRDEIKYDKNKNSKITFFFPRKKKDDIKIEDNFGISDDSNLVPVKTEHKSHAFPLLSKKTSRGKKPVPVNTKILLNFIKSSQKNSFPK